MTLPRLYNEHELIRLIALGDEEAFRCIFNNYRDKLYSYASHITRDENLAEEIVQDTFLKIWINRAEMVRIERFDAYLYTIVRNSTFNAIKRLAQEAGIMKELSLTKPEYEYATEETVIYNDYKHLLRQAVDQLPPQQKKIYNLSRNEGLKYDEIAVELKLSRNTVKAHLRKATSTLRSLFINYTILITGFLFLLSGK